jgi:predicted transcriptional regulator
VSRTLIGRTVRRLRAERDISQQALANRLGISASYLNLIEHDQRAVTASLLIKLAETLQRIGARGVPFFFLRVDPAGNVSKRFSAAGFPFARFGGSCPRWVVHTAFAQPGTIQVQIAELPDGAAFLCFAQALTQPVVRFGEPRPTYVVAMGCALSNAGDVVYADGLDLDRAGVGIGLSCRLCDRPDCGSRAFPPLEHRLSLDPLTAGASAYRFDPSKTG